MARSTPATTSILDVPPTAMGQIVTVNGRRWYSGRRRNSATNALEWCVRADLMDCDRRWYGGLSEG